MHFPCLDTHALLDSVGEIFQKWESDLMNAEDGVFLNGTNALLELHTHPLPVELYVLCIVTFFKKNPQTLHTGGNSKEKESKEREKGSKQTFDLRSDSLPNKAAEGMCEEETLYFSWHTSQCHC